MNRRHLWYFIPNDGTEPFPLFWSNDKPKGPKFGDQTRQHQQTIKWLLSDDNINPNHGVITHWGYLHHLPEL